MSISLIFLIIALVFFLIVFIVQIPVFLHIGKKEKFSRFEYFCGGSMEFVLKNLIKDQYLDSKTFSNLLIIFRISLIGFFIFMLIFILMESYI